MHKADKVALDNCGYLCRECAERLGGCWPYGHCATFHYGTCDVCKKEGSLGNVGDWDWPDGRYRGMRD